MRIMKSGDVLSAPATPAPDRQRRWLATGGLVGAILASSCCIAPLALLTAGISGAWIGNLTALAPWKPAFAAASLALVGLGFRQVYFGPKPDCAEGSYCARPESSILIKTVLWLSTALVLLALTVDWWAPLLS